MTALLDNFIHLQALGSVALLCAFLIATTVFQRRALQRSKDTLENAAPDIKTTVSYLSAYDFLHRRQAPSLFVNPTYAIPRLVSHPRRPALLGRHLLRRRVHAAQ